MSDNGTNAAIWRTVGQMVGRGTLSLQVSGQCMDPHIKDQARVTIRSARMYLPGDVLVVQRRSHPPFVHRLIGCFPSKGVLRFITQADNSTTPDGSVSREAIIGKVYGGQCSARVVNIPLSHRAKAVGRFLTYLATRFRQQTWSLLKTT